MESLEKFNSQTDRWPDQKSCNGKTELKSNLQLACQLQPNSQSHPQCNSLSTPNSLSHWCRPYTVPLECWTNTTTVQSSRCDREFKINNIEIFYFFTD